MELFFSYLNDGNKLLLRSFACAGAGEMWRERGRVVVGWRWGGVWWGGAGEGCGEWMVWWKRVVLWGAAMDGRGERVVWWGSAGDGRCERVVWWKSGNEKELVIGGKL